VCGAPTLRLLYAFGAQPVAGYLDMDRSAARDAPRFPLAIARCDQCGLVQQGHDDTRGLLVEKVYSRYHSTYSASARVSAYAESFVARCMNLAAAAAGDHAIEIGSNDGAMLRLLKSRGLQPAGFEPSGNLNELARSSGAHIIENYFGADAARVYRNRYPPARLIVSRHTLEHAFEPLDFVKGIAIALADDGLAAVEVPDLRLQLVSNHFEAMTFQHVCFYTIGSLQRLFACAGLTIVDVEYVGMDGGSIVVFARHEGARRSGTVDAALAAERTAGLDGAEGYRPFFERIDRVRRQVREALVAFAGQGRGIIAYGAGSKGQSLLNMLALDSQVVRAVRDDTVEGPRWIPGAAIPVVAGSDPLADRPDVVFLTAPTHIQELMARDPYAHALYVATVPDWHFVPRAHL
jgi:hypothetical protein